MTEAATDHPADVLREFAEKMTRSITATNAERMATFHAADFLHAYEEEFNVTFTALDKDALAYVRDQWAKGVNGDPQADLYGAVKALLGLTS